MSINLIETIQKNLQYPPLLKIDPNTQEVKADESKPNENRFSQAAIPAVLTGLYKYAQSDEGADTILRGDISTNWVSLIFGDTAGEIVDKIAAYSFYTYENSLNRMNEIAVEAVRLIKENIKPEASKMDVKDFMASQRNTILLFLPEALHLGELLQDTTLDDNTHKMEGPISSLIQKIGSAFSKPADESEIK